MIVWFGPDWDSMLCKLYPNVITPTGELCAWCNEPIGSTDQGVMLPALEKQQYQPYHLDCYIRLVAGSVAHQMQTCPCFDGKDDEEGPPNSTKRQAAKQAADLFRSQLMGYCDRLN